MVKCFFTALLCILLFPVLTAQNKYDYSWVIGSKFYRHEISFQADTFHYNFVMQPSLFQMGTSLSMSDANGNYIFSSNGCRIFNRLHQLMENGGGLNPGWVQTEWCDGNAYTQMNAILSLPMPGNDSVYYVFHLDFQLFEFAPDYWNDAANNLYYSIVDMRLGNGLGAVTQKNIPIITDTLTHGALTAVRHANGRDWWILYPEERSNCYYKILLDPQGIHVVGKQCIGVVWEQALTGGCLFTAKGDKYIRSDSDRGLNIFDFDRCTGMLSNDIHISLAPDTFLITGLSISHNDRFVYVTYLLKVYQFDLWASDIAASKTLVGVYDGYWDLNQADIHNPRLAPDGKIYMTTTGDVKSLHVIHAPNKKGVKCRFENHGISLLKYTSLAMPIFPNYRVGPVDNSSCDTLGLDNHPLARFTWEQEDSSDPLQVSFTDISEYEPQTWHWSFGDGSASQDTSPVHLYAQPGIYEVCLVVANEYSSDTLCRWLNLDVTSTKDDNITPFEINVFPNPFTTHLGFNGSDYQQGQVDIYDITGRKLATKNWVGRQLDWNLTDLPTGVYFYKIHTDKGFSQVGKIIKGY